MNDSARAPLTTLERWAIGALFSALVLFGMNVEFRGALGDRRMGDFGCYARGAWAVYSGAKLYDVVDNNRWHYNYPPFFAILFVPTADPPAPPEKFGSPPFLPYAVSVGLWFILSLVFLAYAIHTLASVIEEHSRDPDVARQPRFCRRWWALRILPLLVCLIPVCHTLMRGQVNTLILAMLCAMIAAFVRRQNFRAGLWLALAASIKVIPVYLAVYPFVKRDWRCLLGWSAGLAATLGLLPLLVWGPAGTIDTYADFGKTLLGPAFNLSHDTSRKDELLGKGLTDNQSLKFAPFNLLHPDIHRRSPDLPSWAEWTWKIGGLLLTGLTLAAGFKAARRGTAFPARPDGSPVMFLGGLIFLMCVLSPVCHLHYFTYMVPIIMALLAQHWEFRRDLRLSPLLCGLLGTLFIANLLPHLPALELVVRDVGLPLYAGLGIWLLAIVRLWQGEKKCIARNAAVPLAA